MHQGVAIAHLDLFDRGDNLHGILSTLTTITKNVVRVRKGQTTPHAAKAASTLEPDGVETDEASTAPHEILEAAILAEGEAEARDGAIIDAVEELELEPSPPVTQPDWEAVAVDDNKLESRLGAELRVVSVGEASVESDGNVRLPLVLGDESGRTRSLVLSLRLDAADDEGND